MAIQRIPGEMLENNLTRGPSGQKTDLAFETDLLYLDVVNGRIGVGTDSPSSGTKLDVNGSTRIRSNLTVDGDVFVKGSSFDVETTTLEIEDPIILLNQHGSGADIDSGIMIDRGAENNAALYWNEGEDCFKAVTTTSNSDATAIVDTALARIQVADPVGANDVVTKAYFEANSSAPSLLLGYPDDSTYADGAYTGMDPNNSIADAIDDLNETMENIRNNTYVKSVTFVADQTVGGAGLTVTLTLTVVGNATRYDIDWGTGETPTTATTDSTPSHTYSSNTNSPFTVTVTAYNHNATSGSAGSTASSTRTNYIIIYTANPVVSYDFYRASSGGSAISGNDLYVIEGNSLYMDNNTTNIGAATVDYTMAWGDGSSDDSIANDSADGGTAGARLQHTWGAGTSSGTGRDTTTLTLNNHSTANPAAIPTSANVLLKVYASSPSAPNGLSAKTISFSGSVGTSPRLSVGATDNTGGATYSAGDSVNRTVATSGTIDSSTLSTYAYNASSGTLTANVNGSGDGNRTFTSGDDSGTYTSLVITGESDYQLLDATGSTVAFANSIYYPGAFTGFKAKVAKSAAGVSAGINSFQLSHDVTGATNVVEFVKDDVTATPTTTIGTVTEGTAGTYQYISGIPYYDSGSPALTITGTTVANFTGQTYAGVTNPLEIDPGTRSSGSGNIISNLDYTYANVDGASTMLTGGIPNVDVGVSSAYTLATLSAAITTSNIFAIQRIKARAQNCNGFGSYSESSQDVAVFTATATGLNKEQGGIAVSDSLGSTYDDDGLRIYDFNADTTDTPSYTSATNFYTNDLFTGNKTVAGTQEAITIPSSTSSGTISHDETDYSTRLPAGPDLSSGRSGAQYYTFAFRRTNVANFTVTLTGTVSGFFIAAPGTTIDSASGLNGWLDASITYGGSGVPGSDTGNGGNGSNGCAFTSGDRIQDGVSYSAQSFELTLGSENMSNAQDNVVLVRIKLNSGDSVTALSIA
jgi:hypothetical protein